MPAVIPPTDPVNRIAVPTSKSSVESDVMNSVVVACVISIVVGLPGVVLKSIPTVLTGSIDKSLKLLNGVV